MSGAGSEADGGSKRRSIGRDSSVGTRVPRFQRLPVRALPDGAVLDRRRAASPRRNSICVSGSPDMESFRKRRERRLSVDSGSVLRSSLRGRADASKQVANSHLREWQAEFRAAVADHGDIPQDKIDALASLANTALISSIDDLSDGRLMKQVMALRQNPALAWAHDYNLWVTKLLLCLSTSSRLAACMAYSDRGGIDTPKAVSPAAPASRTTNAAAAASTHQQQVRSKQGLPPRGKSHSRGSSMSSAASLHTLAMQSLADTTVPKASAGTAGHNSAQARAAAERASQGPVQVAASPVPSAVETPERSPLNMSVPYSKATMSPVSTTDDEASPAAATAIHKRQYLFPSFGKSASAPRVDINSIGVSDKEAETSPEEPATLEAATTVTTETTVSPTANGPQAPTKQTEGDATADDGAAVVAAACATTAIAPRAAETAAAATATTIPPSAAVTDGVLTEHASRDTNNEADADASDTTARPVSFSSTSSSAPNIDWSKSVPEFLCRICEVPVRSDLLVEHSRYCALVSQSELKFSYFQDRLVRLGRRIDNDLRAAWPKPSEVGEGRSSPLAVSKSGKSIATSSRHQVNIGHRRSHSSEIMNSNSPALGTSPASGNGSAGPAPIHGVVAVPSDAGATTSSLAAAPPAALPSTPIPTPPPSREYVCERCELPVALDQFLAHKKFCEEAGSSGTPSPRSLSLHRRSTSSPTLSVLDRLSQHHHHHHHHHSHLHAGVNDATGRLSPMSPANLSPRSDRSSISSVSVETLRDINATTLQLLRRFCTRAAGISLLDGDNVRAINALLEELDAAAVDMVADSNPGLRLLLRLDGLLRELVQVMQDHKFLTKKRAEYTASADAAARAGANGAAASSAAAASAASGTAVSATGGASGRRLTRCDSFPTHAPSVKDFEILKPISRGAYGTIFLVRKKRTGDLYAMKVLRKDDLRRKNSVERAKAEQLVMAFAQNPFVVRLYYSFQSKRFLYLVMEYCSGGDLFSLLNALYRLESDMARMYIAETVLALEYLHDHGIVHRDLKPDNLLINQDGHIKLTDFGLSRIGLVAQQQRLGDDHDRASAPGNTAAAASQALAPGTAPGSSKSDSDNGNAGGSAADDSNSHGSSGSSADIDADEMNGPFAFGSPSHHHHHHHHHHQQRGSSHRRRRRRSSRQRQRRASVSGRPRVFTVPGTPDYLAPEIILGTGHGPEVDWWAVGVILYEFLTGAPPFNAETTQAVFENILHCRLDWPDDPDVPEQARDLITKLLTFDVDQRLGSKRGAAEIKEHPYFDGINWDTLLQSAPPFVPQPTDMLDTSYFEARKLLYPSIDTVIDMIENDEQDSSDADSPPGTPGGLSAAGAASADALLGSSAVSVGSTVGDNTPWSVSGSESHLPVLATSTSGSSHAHHREFPEFSYVNYTTLQERTEEVVHNSPAMSPCPSHTSLLTDDLTL